MIRGTVYCLRDCLLYTLVNASSDLSLRLCCGGDEILAAVIKAEGAKTRDALLGVREIMHTCEPGDADGHLGD